MFQRLGKDLLDMDLGYLSALGWFTLANLLINEIRSILENLIACGYQVPEILKRGLEITKTTFLSCSMTNKHHKMTRKSYSRKNLLI